MATRGLRREWGTGEAKITGVEFFDKNGILTDRFKWNDALEARVSYESEDEIRHPVFGFALSDANGRIIYGNNTQIEKFDIPVIKGKGSSTLVIDNILMSRGNYLFSFSLHSSDHKINYHRLDNTFPIAVESDKPFEGCCHMPCRWK